MTTPSTARKAGPFTGNGTQNSWPFTFKVFAAGDIKVTIADATGAETVLTLGTHYTVSVNANQDTSPGGSVTYLLTNAYKLTITGNIGYDQPLDIPGGGNFNPVAFENQLDRMVMQTQQLAEQMVRAVKVPVTDDGTGELSGDLAQGILLLSPITEDIATVAGDIAAVENVSTNIAVVSAVGGNITNVNTVAGIAGNVTSVAGNATNINAVATKTTQITQVAAIDDEVAAVAGNAANINAVAGSAANVNTVAASISNVNAVASNATNVNTVAGISADVSDVAAVAADIGVVADNVVDITNFADVYQGPKLSNPALRNDGGALQYGDMYFNTTFNTMRAYGSGGWVDAGTPIPLTITPQTFSGNGATTTFTLSTPPAFEAACDVYISGLYQVVDVDFNVVGTSLTFTTAPPAGTDNIQVKILSAYAGGVPNNGSVTTDKIATDAVTADKIAAGAVGNSELATDSVTADKIAAGAVGSSELATGAAVANIGFTPVSNAADENIGGKKTFTGAVQQSSVAVAALDINCTAGNYFTKTIAGASTFTFSNAPAGVAYAFTFELTHTSGAVTWPATVAWPAGIAPTLTAGKTHLFMFVTDDGGTRWRGASLADYAN
jgi:hypothetical protein